MIKIAIVAIARGVRSFTRGLGVATLLAVGAHAHRAAASDEVVAPPPPVTDEVVAPPPPVTDEVVAPPPQTITTTRWYGWQTLLGDAPALAAFALSATTDNSSLSSAFAISGLVLYSTVAPAVHLVHRRPGIAGADLAVRLGAPVVGAIVGMLVSPWLIREKSCEQNDVGCAFGALGTMAWTVADGIAYGGMAGAVSAMAIDSLVLAREKVVVQSSPHGVSWSPTIKQMNGGATVGVIGQF